MESWDVAVIGSLNMDLVIGTPRFPQPGETLLAGPFATASGGKGLNQALAAARQGARTRLVGSVGDDAYGAELRDVLALRRADQRARSRGASTDSLVSWERILRRETAGFG